jgi:hypothetical protein
LDQKAEPLSRAFNAGCNIHFKIAKKLRSSNESVFSGHSGAGSWYLAVFGISDAPTSEYTSIFHPNIVKNYKYLAFFRHVWGISKTLIEALFGKKVAISNFFYFFKMPISKAKLHGQVIFSHLWNNDNKMQGVYIIR